jgi:small neutral amino acid transporter SnatA (MarC family)
VLQIILLLFIVLDPFGNMVTINSLLQEMEPGRRRMGMLLVMMAVQMVLDGIRLYQQAG